MRCYFFFMGCKSVKQKFRLKRWVYRRALTRYLFMIRLFLFLFILCFSASARIAKDHTDLSGSGSLCKHETGYSLEYCMDNPRVFFTGIPENSISESDFNFELRKDLLTSPPYFNNQDKSSISLKAINRVGFIWKDNVFLYNLRLWKYCAKTYEAWSSIINNLIITCNHKKNSLWYCF